MAIGRTNAVSGGGGGVGAVLTVTAPAGVTVSVSKDGKTKTKTANSEGLAVFTGLETGTWTLTITDGVQTSTKTVVITADYNAVIAFFSATINITYPAGSTCTCSDGTTTFTAPDTSGTWKCVVSNKGTWTVSCTDGIDSTSETVEITADGQSVSVELSYILHIIQNGKVNPIYGFSSQLRVDHGCSATQGTGVYTVIAGDEYSNGLATTNKIDVSGYSTLKAKITLSEHHGQQTYLALVSGKNYNTENELIAGMVCYKQLANNNNVQTISVDISRANSSYYVGMVFIKPDMISPVVKITDIWLE